MLEGNDRSMVRDLALDRSLAAQAAYRFDWTGTWKLEPAWRPDGGVRIRGRLRSSSDSSSRCRSGSRSCSWPGSAWA